MKPINEMTWEEAWTEKMNCHVRIKECNERMQELAKNSVWEEYEE